MCLPGRAYSLIYWLLASSRVGARLCAKYDVSMWKLTSFQLVDRQISSQWFTVRPVLTAGATCDQIDTTVRS